MPARDTPPAAVEDGAGDGLVLPVAGVCARDIDTAEAAVAATPDCDAGRTPATEGGFAGGTAVGWRCNAGSADAEAAAGVAGFAWLGGRTADMASPDDSDGRNNYLSLPNVPM